MHTTTDTAHSFPIPMISDPDLTIGTLNPHASFVQMYEGDTDAVVFAALCSLAADYARRTGQSTDLVLEALSENLDMWEI